MAKLLSAPARFIKEGNARQDQELILATDDFLSGLIADLDKSKIPLNGLTEATNTEYSRHQLMRRNGLTNYSVTKPNSQKVMELFGYFLPSTGLNLLRFTRDTLHKATGSGWLAFTPSGIAAFSGTDIDYFSLTVADNRCFATNGIDPIREIDALALTYSALGNAPCYRYLATVLNRIVGAYNVDTDIPFELGWSGDLNYEEWDPNVDISAGSTPLVDSPADTSDDITGLFSYAGALLVPRMRSVWVGTGVPSATNPFNFISALPRVGADLPRCISMTTHGLVWYSNIDNDVHVWLPGQSDTERIATDRVRRAIRIEAAYPDYMWSSFNHDLNKYSLYIANPNESEVIEYAFNFESKCWTRNTFLNISAVSDIDFVPSITIDELAGTIDSLAGTINSLGGTIARTTRYFGFMTGELKYQEGYYGTADESVDIALTDDGEEFTTVIAYKELKAPKELPNNLDYLWTNVVRCSLIPRSVGTVNLQYSKDEGTTWVTAKSVTFVTDNLNKTYELQLRKAMRVKSVIWRITTDDCMIINRAFYAQAFTGGLVKTG